MSQFHFPPDSVAPEDVPHEQVFMPIQRPEHDRRRHTLLCDAYDQIDRICKDEFGFRDLERHIVLTDAFHDALRNEAVQGGFLSVLGFVECDPPELLNMGFTHARVGPYIADWYSGLHRQGAYVVNAKQLASFFADDLIAASRADILVHADAPVAVRFFAGEGLRLAQSLMPIKQIALAHELRATFKKRHPDVKLNEKVFDMMAAAYIT